MVDAKIKDKVNLSSSPGLLAGNLIVGQLRAARNPRSMSGRGRGSLMRRSTPTLRKGPADPIHFTVRVSVERQPQSRRNQPQSSHP